MLELLLQVVLPIKSEEVRPINRLDLIINSSRYPLKVKDKDY